MRRTELNSGGVNDEFAAISSPIGEVLRTLMKFYDAHPDIERRIHLLQLRHALLKKRQRQQDKDAVLRQTGELFGDQDAGHCKVRLGCGRSRMHPRNVFLFAMVRACMGGPHSRMGLTLAMDSMSVRALLHPATKVFPAATTILENINLLDEKTLTIWLKRQLRWIQQMEGTSAGWEQVTVDSTAIAAAATFPVDSSLLVKAVEQLWRVFARMYADVGIRLPQLPKVQRWRKQLQSAHKAISMGAAKKGAAARRRQLYRQMVDQAILLIRNLHKVRETLLEQQVRAEQQLGGRQLRRAQRYSQLHGACLSRCLQVLGQINARVLEGGKVAAVDKLLSLCDRDAAIIVKGAREAVFGYKVQLAFNQPGYCTAALINKGNGADSASLEAVVLQQNHNSAITAEKLSVDDGYAGNAAAEKVGVAGVTTLSVSGAKGKQQLGENTYHEAGISALRCWRSAAESRIFTFKNNQHAHRLKRYGRAAAGADILSKVLVFNAECLVRRGRQKNKPPKAVAA